jgi:competence ComEA-like helix-hairpin-helix protein
MSMLGFLFKDRHNQNPDVLATRSAGVDAPNHPGLGSGGNGGAPPTAPNFEEIRHALNQIAEVLGRGEGYDLLKVSTANITAIDLPMSDVIKVCPEAFQSPWPDGPGAHRPVSVLVEDVFDQLSKGRIETSVKNLVADVPPDYLVDQVEKLYENSVSLPLALVVSAVNPDELRKRTTNRLAPTGIEEMPNLFNPATPDRHPVAPPVPPAGDIPEEAATSLETMDAVLDETLTRFETSEPPAEVAEEPVVETGMTAEATVVESEPAGPPVPEEDPVFDAPLDAPVDSVSAAPAAADRAHELPLRGLDLNTASALDLVARLDGVGRRLAERIVRTRQERGFFLDFADLARVPGLGRKTYEKITGLPWPENEDEVPEDLMGVLAASADHFLNVREITARFSTLPGFEGCIIAHQDGYVLASSWADASGDAVGAFAPQIFKKIARYVNQLRQGKMKSVTVMLDQRPLTFIQNDDLYFVAVHRVGSFTCKQIRLAQGVGSRLGRLLRSRRSPA